MKTIIFLIYIFVGLNNLNAEFIRYDNLNVVIDTQRKVMWSDNNITTGDFDTAIQTCYDLTFAEYDDWRLPNINELRTILDRGADNNGTYIDSAFKYLGSSSNYHENWYLSSTSLFNDNVWVVIAELDSWESNYGVINLLGKHNESHPANDSKTSFKCVRDFNPNTFLEK